MNPVAIDLLLNATFAKDIHKKDRTVTSQMNKILKFMQESMGAGNKVTPFGIIPGVGPDGEEVVKGFRFLTGNAQSAQKAVSEVNEYLNRISTGLYENDNGIWGTAQLNESAKLFETGSAHVLSADIKSFLKQLSGLGGSVISTNDVIGGQTIRYQVPTSRAWGSEAPANALMGGAAAGYESGYKEFLRARKNQRARELYAQRKLEKEHNEAFWADYGSVELADWRGYAAEAERARKLEQRQAQEKRAAIAYGSELRGRGLEEADFSAIGSEGSYSWLTEEDATEEAAKKRNTGYVPAAALASQDERRRQLGIVTDENTSDIADKQDKKAFFTKSLAALTSILATVSKIATTLWKLAEHSIQTRYESMSYGVNPNVLVSFQNALENVSINRNEANKAVGAVVGGLVNRFNLDEGLIQRLAPVMGEDLAGTVKQMLSKEHDPIGALSLIMENARRRVENPGSIWDVQSMSDQLGVFGPSFLGYMNWVSRQEKPAGKSFYDFIGTDPAKYLDISADAASNYKELFGRAKHYLQNVGRGYLGGGARQRSAAVIYESLGIDPSKMSLEDLIEALKMESSPDINSYYRKFGTGRSPNGTPYYRQEMLKDLEVLERALERLQSSDGFSLLTPSGSSTGPLIESTAYGFGGTGAASGGIIYNETDNSVHTSPAAGGGSMDISLNIRGGGKDMGTYPLEINANNMITIDYWS